VVLHGRKLDYREEAIERSFAEDQGLLQAPVLLPLTLFTQVAWKGTAMVLRTIKVALKDDEALVEQG
jgi:hypothetical protein